MGRGSPASPREGPPESRGTGQREQEHNLHDHHHDHDTTTTTQPPTTTTEAGAVKHPIPAGTTEAQWHALRQCESTQNYRAVSKSGRYRGAYQFSIRTWDWVAGMHYPDLVGVDPIDASPSDQDKMAYQLYEINGWDPWPTCRKRLPS